MNLDALLPAFPLHRRAEVQQRFEEHLPRLDASLRSLYGDDAHYPHYLQSVCEVMASATLQRGADLQELDAKRLADPNWFCAQDMLGYCAYVDRFGGTLFGVQEKIPHLQTLGVRYLHLLPFLKARKGENDGGFAVASFEEVQAELGTIEDLRTLTTALRASGISLCSDFVLNHVADDHAWAVAAQNGDQGFQEFFHIFENRALPDRYEQSLGQIFPQAAPGNFTYHEGLQKWVWTTFYPFQWDLNYANPRVFLHIVSALLQLANCGIEVFRLDSAAFLWKRLGTNCMNQPEAHRILQALRCIVQIAAPAVILKAEAIVATADLPAYLGKEDGSLKECQIAYHSSLMAAAWMALSEQKVDVLQTLIERTPSLPHQTSWLTYVRCHDDIGWNVLRAEVDAVSANPEQAQLRLQCVSNFYSEQGQGFADGLRFQASDPKAVHGTVGMSASLCGVRGDGVLGNELAVRRMLLLYALAMSFGGLPLIYMGDELGQVNDRSYFQDAERSHDGRWLQRPRFDEEAMRQLSAGDQSSVAGAVYQGLAHMLKIRRALRAFDAQSPRRSLAISHQSVLGFARGFGNKGVDDAVICLFNFSPDVVTLDFAEIVVALPENVCDTHSSTWYVQDLQRQFASQLSDASSIQLEAYSILWLHK